MYDVAIIGGGVVGCCIARELSRYRLKTVLLEKEAEVSFGTSKTNSGIIHPGHHSSPETLKGSLVVRGNSLYDMLEEELGFGFERIGEIVVARTEEDMAHLEELLRIGEIKGVPGLEMWDQAKLRHEEPNLSRKLLGALYAPSAGVINPYEFTFALVESAVKNGVEMVVDAPATAIDDAGEHLTVHTPKGAYEARYVLNCAGVFADQVAELLGLHDFTIHPRKGEEYLLDIRLKGLVRRLVFPVPGPVSKGTLIIPTFDGTIMVGPTAQDTDDRHDVATSAEGAAKVFGFVKNICPAIDPRDTIAEFAGLRAASNTGDFIIGTTAVRGFINVAGIQSPGLTAAPAIAEYVLAILTDEGLALEPDDTFIPGIEHPPRFAHRTHAERVALAEQDPRFGRIVCRCEIVTEAEVHKAVDHGARTIDGVKFRTRAGMGRCQGGFCTSRVMEILADREGISLQQVTKRGGDSWMVMPMFDTPTAEEV